MRGGFLQRLSSGAAGLILVATFSTTALAATALTLSVDTLAGARSHPGFSDGPAPVASFFYPSSVAVDNSDGSVVVADTGNHVIRRIAPDGTVTTIAGSPGQPGSSDGFGTAARFRYPNGVAVDRLGNILVADTENCTIRRISPLGQVTTIAGTAGQCGSADARGADASFAHPRGLAVDSDGTIFVADSSNHTIRAIAPDGEVSTFVGKAGVNGFTDGTSTRATFAFPTAIALEPSGALYVADSSNDTIRRVTRDGQVTTLCGTPRKRGAEDGPCATARFTEPTGVALDEDGNLWVVDSEAHTVRRISPDGMVTTEAGISGVTGDTQGDGPRARFDHPVAIATSSGGSMVIADMLNHSIRVGRAVNATQRSRPVHR